MATRKRSISFDADLLRAVERAAQDEPHAGNVSGLVNEALEHHLRVRAMRTFVDEHERELGPVPQWARDEAVRAWPD